MDLLSELNPRQREAVTAPHAPTLVLAGPGSGKTRVLTHRIAHLIETDDVAPYNILAVTFTNKAAGEMRHRVHNLLGDSKRTRGLRIGTFHAICAMLLRIEAESGHVAPYDKTYQIYDTDDQLKVIKQAIEDVGVNIKRLAVRTPYQMLNRISDAKNELITPKLYPRSEYLDEIIARIYERYQQLLQNNNAMDFDDLIMQTVLLLRTNNDVRDHYQKRFEHVLVDEFQDTNMAQYALVRLWGAPQNNVFVVGDEDQAIYGFRGADYRNVRRFRKDYPNAQTILLEQNYRSTQIVLDAARAVIDRNRDRTPKSLFTDRTDGTKIYAYEAYDDKEEAEFIVKEIERLRAAGTDYSAIAIMYRTNAQSRALEKAMVNFRVPFRMLSGVGFYQRREVKDLLAYLRLLDSPADRLSFDRIINTPRRGIGAKTQKMFIGWVESEGISYGDGLLKLVAGAAVPTLGAAANKKLARFGEQLAAWRKLAAEESYGNLLSTIAEEIGYDDHLAQTSDTDDELNDRRTNVDELLGELAAGEFDSLSEYLTDTILATDADRKSSEDKPAVTMLTLHGSKGLEYDVVFLTGLEEGLLPHSRAVEDVDGLEEERRLLYVGITRARHKLYISRAFRRRGGQYYDAQEPSRFLYDLPAHLLTGIGVDTTNRQQSASYQRSTTWGAVPPHEAQAQRDEKIIPFPGSHIGQFKTGMRVLHSKFGEGMVIETQLNRGGQDEEVVVAFEEVGIKRLMASFANLEILED